MTTFFYSVRTFARIQQHYFSKYWEAWMHGPSPTSNFGGGVPPKSPSMIMKNALYYHFFKTSQFSSIGIGIWNVK